MNELPPWLEADAARLRQSASPCLLLLDAWDEGAQLLAREHLRRQLCPREALPACDCLSCRLWAQHQHPDAHVLDESVKIADLRRAAQRWPRTPGLSPRRVVWLQRVDAYGEAVSNALLKSLEEPPAHLIFMLSARQRRGVKATLFSRCHPLALRRPTAEEALQYVMNRRKIARQVAQQLLRQHQGHVYAALRSPPPEEDNQEALWALLAALQRQEFGALMQQLDDWGSAALPSCLRLLAELIRALQWDEQREALPAAAEHLDVVELHRLYARLQALRRPPWQQSQHLIQIKSIFTETRNLL